MRANEKLSCINALQFRLTQAFPSACQLFTISQRFNPSTDMPRTQNIFIKMSYNINYGQTSNESINPWTTSSLRPNFSLPHVI